jgi:hypothetical protein
MATEDDPLRRIADSLSNLEQMYAEDVRRRERQQQVWEDNRRIWRKRFRTGPWILAFFFMTLAIALVGLSVFLLNRLFAHQI